MGLFRRNAEPAARIEPTVSIPTPAAAPAEQRSGSVENPGTPLDGTALLAYSAALGFGPSFAGPPVTEETAMRHTAVFRCVSLLAGLVASLPLDVYERTETGRRMAMERREFRLLHDQPDELVSSFIWREMVMVDLLLGGDHYSLIEYDGAGRITGLRFLPRVSVQASRVNRRNQYRVMLANGGSRVFDQSDILHVPGIGFDGLRSLSPIGSAAKQAIGTGLALEEAVGRLQSNGARPGGVGVAPPGMKPEAFARMKAAFDAAYAGAAAAGKTIWIDNGADWKPMSITPRDAEVMENRRFSIADICRVYGVPPHMVGETDKSTSWGSGIEQQTLGFLRFSMEPWLRRIEAELNRKLFGGTAFYAEFQRDALLAMDAKTRAEVFSLKIGSGVMKPSEARRIENLEPAEGSDQLFINSTLVPIAKAGADRQPTPAEPPTP